jgi:uncharacterized membrane protein (UPF0136 family)
MSSHHLDYTVSAILASGGIFAFIKKKSTPSLIGGLTLAFAFALSGYLIHQRFEYFAGNMLGSASGVALASVGLSRYLKTRKPMPGLALLGLGMAAGGYHGYKLV